MKRTPLRRRRRLRPKFVGHGGSGMGEFVGHRRSSRVHDTDYMLRVKGLSCVARELGLDTGFPCGGVVEADHAGRRGLGQKCSDLETIPLCTEHHRQRTDFSGAFKTWNQARMRLWLAACIDYVQTVLNMKGKAT